MKTLLLVISQVNHVLAISPCYIDDIAVYPDYSKLVSKGVTIVKYRGSDRYYF